jgi:hypothetical protein
VQFSLSDGLALFVFLGVTLTWLVWWRLQEDLELLPEHEQAHPEFPLPSGIVPIADAETVMLGSLTLALLGSWILGWSVFSGFVAATVIVRLMGKEGVDLRRGLRRMVPIAFIGASLAWAGLSFGARELTILPWMTSLILSVAVLVAGLFTLPEIRLQRFGMQVAIMTGVILASVLVSSQSVFWWAIPAEAITFLILAKNPRFRPRWQALPLWLLFAWELFVLAFLAQLIRHK